MGIGSFDFTGLLKKGQRSDFSLKNISVLKEQDFRKFIKLRGSRLSFSPSLLLLCLSPGFLIQICAIQVVSKTKCESHYLQGTLVTLRMMTQCVLSLGIAADLRVSDPCLQPE